MGQVRSTMASAFIVGYTHSSARQTERISPYCIRAFALETATRNPKAARWRKNVRD